VGTGGSLSHTVTLRLKGNIEQLSEMTQAVELSPSYETVLVARVGSWEHFRVQTGYLLRTAEENALSCIRRRPSFVLSLKKKEEAWAAEIAWAKAWALKSRDSE